MMNLYMDHPRVRGEKYALPDNSSSEQGSPPRARGEGAAQREHHAVNGSPPRARGEGKAFEMPVFIDGITPACAGRRFQRR